MEDYWNGKSSFEELNGWGFLSWEEMQIMEESGLVDIQSHTLTHTKYFVTDNLLGFHHPGSGNIYPIWNLFPEGKPYYIENEKFNEMLPFGYPLFDQESAIIAHKVVINDQLVNEMIGAVKKTDFYDQKNYDTVWKTLTHIYREYKKNNRVISHKETEQEYQLRIDKELRLSKELIEENLSKIVHFCCWPHGDFNEYAQKRAIEFGYLMTSKGETNDPTTNPEQFERIGLDQIKNNRFLSLLKTQYKVNSYGKVFPYYHIKQFYERLKYS